MEEQSNQSRNDQGIGEGQLRHLDERASPPNAAPMYAGDEEPGGDAQSGTAGGANVSDQGGGSGSSKQGGNASTPNASSR